MTEPADMDAALAALRQEIRDEFARLEEELTRVRVGSVVVVPIDPRRNHGEPAAPAIVTRVRDAETVDAYVIRHGPYGNFAREGLAYVESFEGLDTSDPDWQQHWTWPGHT